MFHDGWVIVNSVPSHIVTWGGWINDEIPGDYVLVFIPGSPGITDFYYTFLETLFKLTGIPTWSINHAGLEPAPEGLPMPRVEDHPELYQMGGQLEHKKQFIRTYVPSDKKIILMGHSLGGKISEQLMKDEEIADRVLQAHLVFPVLRELAETATGQALQKSLPRIISIGTAFVWVFSFIPISLRRWIISSYVSWRARFKLFHPASFTEGALKLLTPGVVRTLVVLTYDEFKTIKDLDSEVYEKHHDKIFCYFSQQDRWVPLEYYFFFTASHPKLVVHIAATTQNLRIPLLMFGQI